MRGVRDGPAGCSQSRERAVSDLVAFVLMFALILTGVGIVSFGVVGNLSEFSDREQVENAERGMVAAAATIDDIHRQNDTRRTFSLALGGGEVVLNGSAISVTVSGGSGFNGTYQTNAIEHRFDRSPRDVTVVYEAGAVFRSPGAGARYEPAVTCRDDVAIVSLVRLTGSGISIAEGSDTATPLNPRALPSDSPVADVGQSLLFAATIQNRTRTFAQFETNETLRVNVSRSAYPQQWDRHFSEKADRGTEAWTEDGEFVWACDARAALVRVTTVELSL